jgi:hypothetical protein
MVKNIFTFVQKLLSENTARREEAIWQPGQKVKTEEKMR